VDLPDLQWHGEDKWPQIPPKAIALRLFEIIAASEGKILSHSTMASANADRKWVLDTYAECLRTVTNPNGRSAHQETQADTRPALEGGRYPRVTLSVEVKPDTFLAN
jgi:hypothetical protein